LKQKESVFMQEDVHRKALGDLSVFVKFLRRPGGVFI